MRNGSRLALVLLLALAGAPPLEAQTVKAGIEAWQRGDPQEAVAIWRPLAEKGDLDAAFNLGQAYRLGRGVPTNLAAAQAWLERAARKGHVDAQTTLGLLLFENGNQSGGMRWLRQAAERGDARALLVYGTALFNGDGIARDPLLGYAFVSRAAAQGLAPAKTTLSELDKILPLDDRKKAVALAIAKAKSSPPAASRAVPTAKPAKPAKTAETKPKVLPPKPTAPVDAAKPNASSASGSWRIQLGAFSQPSSAEALYRKVSGKLGGKPAFYQPAGAVTRLQIGGYASRAAAQAACNGLKPQPCFPVAAKP
jgi:cell division septation protein DedD